MYGYEDSIDILPEQIYQKVKQESIFEAVLKVEVDLHRKYLSPFREDNKPGCRFEVREDGILLFVDFGERLRSGHTHRTAVMMVMDHFKVSFTTAIKLICEKFGLSTTKSDYAPISDFYKITKQEEQERVKQKARIGYTKKLPTKFDRIFWSQSFTSIDDLTSDNVFPISAFSIENHKGKRNIKLYGPAYAIDFIDAVKIYQPHSTEYRFITNCDEDHIGNYDNLPESGDEVVIKKSYRDHRAIRNLLGIPVIWFQNEGCTPSYELLLDISRRFKLITIFFDNDEPGTLAAIKLFEVFNAIREGSVRIIHLPNNVNINGSMKRNYKDPAECAFKEGRRDTITILNSIGLYGKDS